MSPCSLSKLCKLLHHGIQLVALKAVWGEVWSKLQALVPHQAGGVAGLEDRSRAPKHCPHKLAKAIEDKIIEIRHRLPYLGAYRIQREHHLSVGLTAIYRVIREAGLVRKRRKKAQMKRDRREVKKRYLPFEKIQVDLKELQDLAQYYPYFLHRYPRYQFSARDL